MQGGRKEVNFILLNFFASKALLVDFLLNRLCDKENIVSKVILLVLR